MAAARSSNPEGAGGRPTDRRRRPVAVDLFAGAGGFALGLEQAGFDGVAAVEYDPIHAAAHSYNFLDPDYPGMKLLDRLLGEFEAEGYRWLEPRILNASRYGVPQDRRRLIVLGARKDQALPEYPAPTVRPVPKRPWDKPLPWER